MRVPVVTLLFALVASGALADGVVPPLGGAERAAIGSTVIEEVNLDELSASAPSIEYQRSAWLLALPLLCLLVLACNVDWREQRVTAEIALARAKRAEKSKASRW